MSSQGWVTVAPGRRPGAGSVVLNVLWVLLAGFWLFLGYVMSGLVMCVTIVGIPFGIQSFKLAGFAFWPFGRVVMPRAGGSPSLRVVGNVLWFLFAGIWLALTHAITGLILCATVIGIPLGIANFKLIPLAIAPFGRDIVKKGSVLVSAPGAVAF